MATIPDFKTFTDAELEQTLNAALADQERRRALANTAAQVEALTVKFTEGGGDVAVLQAAVTRGRRPR